MSDSTLKDKSIDLGEFVNKKKWHFRSAYANENEEWKEQIKGKVYCRACSKIVLNEHLDTHSGSIGHRLKANSNF